MLPTCFITVGGWRQLSLYCSPHWCSLMLHQKLVLPSPRLFLGPSQLQHTTMCSPLTNTLLACASVWRWIGSPFKSRLKFVFTRFCAHLYVHFRVTWAAWSWTHQYHNILISPTNISLWLCPSNACWVGWSPLGAFHHHDIIWPCRDVSEPFKALVTNRG